MPPQPPGSRNPAAARRRRVDTGAGVTAVGTAAGVVLSRTEGERIAPRPRPARRPQAASSGLLDREPERAAAAAAIATLRPVRLHGGPGAGKSALLRHLAHEADLSALPQGAIFLSGRGRRAEDLLQALFEACYETAFPYKPTPGELCDALSDRRALVLVDDADLPEDEVDSLLAAAPGCAFVVASAAAAPGGEGLSLGLGRLPRPAALRLLTGELGRSPAAEEATEAEALAAACGHPLRLLQVAAAVHAGSFSLAEARRLAAGPEAELLSALLGPLDRAQRRVLAALAAAGEGALDGAVLAELARLDHPGEVYGELAGRRLLEERGSAYALTGGLAAVLAGAWDLAPWRQWLLASFVRRGEEGGAAASLPAEELPTALRIFAWARGEGRNAEAVRLARAIEEALFAGVAWGAWGEVLEGALSAAEAAGDDAAQAWSLHQLGSRALALGETAAGRDALTRSLALSRSRGDEAAVALTRRNLELIAARPGRPAAAGAVTGPVPAGRTAPVEQVPATEDQPAAAAAAAAPTAATPPAAGSSTQAPLEEHDLDRGLAHAPPAPAARPRSPRRQPSRRGGGRWWIAAAVLLLLAAAATWFFFLRPADVVLGPRGGVAFGEQPASTTGPPRRITVASEGPRRLQITAIEVVGEHAADFPLVEDGCTGRSLARGESCTVDVAFAPQGEEARQAALVVASDGAGAPHRVALTGTGTQPLGTFVPAALTFGKQKVGTRGGARETLLVSSGTAPMEVTEVRLGGEGSSYVLARDECSGQTLPPAGDCELEVAFAPRKEGALQAALEVHGPLLEFPVTARLEGTGTVSRLCLGSTSLAFGEQPLGSSGRQTLTVSSCGSAPLEVGRVTPPAAGSGFAVTSESCSGKTLAPEERCTVAVRFQPAGEGSAEGALGIAAGAAGSPWRVALAGTGTAPHAAARPAGLDFGGRLVATPGDLLQLTVANTGTAPLMLGQLAVTAGEEDFAVTGDACSGQTLAPEASCEVAVAFRPRREGAHRGRLTLPNNSPEGPLTVALAGAGTAPHIAAEPESLRFGEQRVGAPSDPRRLELANTGTAPLAIGGLGIPGTGAFVIDPDRCSGRTLPPGGRCEIGVRFEPPGEGRQEAELRVASNAREGQLRVGLTGAGVVARAVLQPPTLELGGGDFGPRRVTVANSGGAPLQVERLLVDGDRASFTVTGADCTGRAIPPGGSCRLEVRFEPARAGRHEAELTLVHDGEGQRRVRLVGEAPPPPPAVGLAPGARGLAEAQPVEGCESLTLRWEAVTRAWPPVSYDVEVEVLDRTGGWSPTYTATTPDTRETLAEPLPRRQTYRWRVLARDGLGSRGEPSAWSYFSCVTRLE